MFSKLLFLYSVCELGCGRCERDTIGADGKKRIGDVALQDINVKNRSCSVGLGIAKIENRVKGYGTEAVQLMIDYGFRYLGMERITANTLEINVGAQKVISRCGMTLEGCERKAVYLNGNKYDRLCYAILKEEYFCEK